MLWNRHFIREHDHAFLGASKYHWTNYDLEKLRRIWENQFEAAMGSRKHAWAAEAIRLGIRQQRSKKTINAYINDAIGFRMDPEIVLKVNDDAFGTCDAISFRDGVLRIHDLKTGRHPGNMRQLEVYAAFYCLEYNINPYNIEMYFRIYQLDQIIEMVGDPKVIRDLMNHTKACCAVIEELRELMA